MTDIERLARAFARAEGHDPDALYVKPDHHPVGPYGTIIVSRGDGFQPTTVWHLYVLLAQVAIVEMGVQEANAAEPEPVEIKDVAPLDNWRDRYGLNGHPRIRSTFTPPK